MAKNLFALGSLDERGKISGGKAGNQNGKELKVADYYQFGQSQVIRFKSVTRGRKAAKIAKTLAKCSAIGYDQSERHTLYNICRGYAWNYAKVASAINKGTFPKCECDCSSLASTVINLAYGKQKLPCSTTTATIAGNTAKYPKNFKRADNAIISKKFHKGDLVVAPGKHVIINV